MSKASEALFAPLQLKSGQVLGTRIAKAAMEEGMAGRAQLPDERLITLYWQWGAGGTGLLITGNVMVHADAIPVRVASCSMPTPRWSPSRRGRN